MHSFLLLASLFKRPSEPYEFAFAAILFVFTTLKTSHPDPLTLYLGRHFEKISTLRGKIGHVISAVCQGLLPTIRHLENRRGEGPGDEVEGLLGKFDLPRLHGHSGSRGLQQNVVLGWHFKEILIRT